MLSNQSLDELGNMLAPVRLGDKLATVGQPWAALTNPPTM